MMSSLAPCIPCPVMGEGRVRSACGWCCSLTTGFDHRIGHFRLLIHTAGSFASLLLAIPFAEPSSTALLGIHSTAMMHDDALHV